MAGAMLLLAGGLGAFSAPAEATIFKCRDAKGETYFTDKGCAGQAAPARLVATPQEVAGAIAPPPAALEIQPAAAPELLPAVVPTSMPVAARPLAVPKPQFQAARPSNLIEPPAPVIPAGARGEAGGVTGDGRAAGAPAEPLRPRKVQAVQWWLIGAGLTLLMLTHAWMIAIAFRAGSTAWGVALILLSPLSNLAYTVTHFRKAGYASIVGFAAIGALAYAYVPATDLIEVVDSYLTTRGSTDLGERKARIIFTKKETVCLKTVLRWNGQWDDWWVGRNRRVSWLWTTDGRVRNHHSVQIDFDKTPFVLLGYMPAGELGPGSHRVEVRIDDNLFDTREFDVR